jgi:DNA-binding MarR family transcriptional regulator/GNAT superfamily N-acetyltransferase
MGLDQVPGCSLADDISAFRQFNRMYTRFIGTLDEGLLKSEYTLTEARVLYEVATRTAPKAQQIAQELGIDPGYLSRILAKFESSGLLKPKVTGQVGRSKELSLTRKGRSAFKELNSRSDQQAQTIFERLTPDGRTQLVHSMRAIQNVLIKTDESRPLYILRPDRVGDMGWVVHREAVGYAEEYGFDETFEALVARIVADFIASFDPQRERCWIAEVDGQSVGHVFLVKHPELPNTAKLRLLFVERSARGMGLGHALVSECIRFARSAGYETVQLWTQSILTAARRIYENNGFRLVQEEPHQSFGKDLIGQTWELSFPEGRV